MSRSTVRTAITSYLAPGGPGAVTNLVDLRRAKPRNFGPTARFNTGQPSTAVGFVHIESVVESRAATGKKLLTYTCAVVFLFRSSRSGPTAGEDAMDDFDAIVEGIKASLRVKSATSQPLGLLAPSSIFNAAEGLLDDDSDLPQDKAADRSAWGRVRFDVVEMVTA